MSNEEVGRKKQASKRMNVGVSHTQVLNGAAMSVKVLFFASCREVIGKESPISIFLPLQRHLICILFPLSIFKGLEHIEVKIPSDITAAQCDTKWLMQQVVANYPDLEPFMSTVKLAVNRKYIRFDVEVKAGDEVAFIPPISGG